MLVAFYRFQFQFWSFLVLFEAVWALLRFRDVPTVALNLRPRVRLAFFYQMTSCLQLRQALGSSAMRPVVRGALWEVRYREAHCGESAVENLLNATSI